MGPWGCYRRQAQTTLTNSRATVQQRRAVPEHRGGKTAQVEPDPKLDNYVRRVTVNGQAADVQVVKPLHLDDAAGGETVTSRWTWTFNGPNEATGVEVLDAPSARLHLRQRDAVGKGRTRWPRGRWSAGTLASRGSWMPRRR